MADELSECLSITAAIQHHFVAQGWQPLLPVKVNGLHTVSLDKLQRLRPRVLAAGDRMAAVTVILDAVIPGNDPPPKENDDLSESAVLRLRLPQG